MLFPGNESWSEAEENRTGALGALGGPGAPDGPGPEAVVVPVLFGLIFVLGMVGNCLVLAVVGRARYGSGPGVPRGVSAGHSPTNLFILNLSVADLCFLLVCVPVHATIYSLPQWLFGSFLCTFGHYVFTVCMLVSVFTLSAMSVDRYVAVVLSRRAACVRSRRNALLAVALIWSLALVLSVPVAQHQVVTGHPHAPNSTFCWERWYGPSRAAYRVTVLLLGYVLPLLLICVSYSKVLFHLHKKMKNMSKKSERSKKKTAQTVLLVVLAFALCWLPHHVIVLWVEFGHFPLTDASFALRIVAHCLAYGNSCVNPVLYAFLSENFRKACREVCGCCTTAPPAGQSAPRLRMDNFSTTYSTTNI